MPTRRSPRPIAPDFLNGDKIYSTLKPTTRLQMIAVHDIGQYGALAFTDAARFKNFELDIAGDSVTMPEAAAALSKGPGGRSTTSRSRSPTCAGTAKMSR